VIIFAEVYKLYIDDIKTFETEVLRERLKRKPPILAICSGTWTIKQMEYRF
jgi:gamma-glutamyl-gamma-aminobutyrate hydrolase PuuD|tara:strand:+ start:419 stop:571 length:153 start_codon:yes stop_codon:yes gene_type:complete